MTGCVSVPIVSSRPAPLPLAVEGKSLIRTASYSSPYFSLLRLRENISHSPHFLMGFGSWRPFLLEPTPSPDLHNI